MALNSVLGKLLFSREPKLPDNERLDINTEQGKAVAGNQKVLPATETRPAGLSTNSERSTVRLTPCNTISGSGAMPASARSAGSSSGCLISRRHGAKSALVPS